MEKWGDGARAIVRVQWNDYPGGHVFIAENIGGKVRFMDPQNGESSVGRHFNHAKAHETYVVRIDNLKIGDNVKKCCEKRSGS